MIFVPISPKQAAVCQASREPLFIAKNGYGDLVVMSKEPLSLLPCAILPVNSEMKQCIKVCDGHFLHTPLCIGNDVSQDSVASDHQAGHLVSHVVISVDQSSPLRLNNEC